MSVPDSVSGAPRQALPPGNPRPRGPFFGCLLVFSLIGNLVALAAIAVVCIGMFRSTSDDTVQYPETYHSGSRKASDKVAIVSIEGVILEGLIAYPTKQIEQAARDEKVKAVVVRVNSPGGSITASEELHERIIRLRDGDPDQKDKNNQPLKGKPVVVSMGSLAASGGYYISVPGKKLFAEPTTTTGSIGVYTSLPNLKGVSEKYGFTMITIKAGEIKDAGSMFGTLTPRERQVFQDMVNESYERFMDVISKDRKELTRAKLLARFPVKPLCPDPQAPNDPEAVKKYTRYRADGGGYSAAKAKELGLIDAIGTLDDAVKEAAKLAGLTNYKAVRYHKTLSISELLLSRQNVPPSGSAAVQIGPSDLGLLEADRLESALTPRIWYLAPGHEAAAFAAAARAARSNP
jgi:protease-4